MDVWTDRKFSDRKLPSKSDKSYPADIKQLILPSTILEFKLLVIDDFMEENAIVPLSQNWN